MLSKCGAVAPRQSDQVRRLRTEGVAQPVLKLLRSDTRVFKIGFDLDGSDPEEVEHQGSVRIADRIAARP